MEKELAAGGLTLVDVGLNLIDQVWTDKPEDIVSGKIEIKMDNFNHFFFIFLSRKRWWCIPSNTPERLGKRRWLT